MKDDADISVEQIKLIVVLHHHDRPGMVTSTAAPNQGTVLQFTLQCGVERFRSQRTPAMGTEHRKSPEPVQKLLRIGAGKEPFVIVELVLHHKGCQLRCRGRRHQAARLFGRGRREHVPQTASLPVFEQAGRAPYASFTVKTVTLFQHHHCVIQRPGGFMRHRRKTQPGKPDRKIR